MSYFPIFLQSVPTDSWAEKIEISLVMFARGMGTVFIVLMILWGIISLFRVFSMERKPAKAEPKAVDTLKEETEEESSADDNAVIAAIMAAIEAYRSEEGNAGLPYRVVSFKRKDARKGWTNNEN